MKNNFRFWIGVTCLAILIAYFISFSNISHSILMPTSSIHDSSILGIWDKIGMFMLIIWLGSSALIKVTMIANKKIKTLNTVSVATWVMMILSALFSIINHTSPSTATSSGTHYLISALLIFGWPIVDAIDLYFIKKEEKNNHQKLKGNP